MNKITVCTLLGVFFCTTLFAASPTDEGWNALTENNFSLATERFSAALEAEPANMRALLGLSFVYQVQEKPTQAFKVYQKAVETSPIKHALIYAGMSTERMSAGSNDVDDELVDLLNDVLDSPDPSGIVRAMALERLGAIEESRGNVDQARDYYNSIGAVMDWQLIGPFNNVSASGHSAVYAPEKDFNPAKQYEGADGGLVWWFTPKNYRKDKWIDFTLHFPTVEGVFYANTFVYSEQTQAVQFRLGTSGAFKLFLNGSMISETVDEHNNDLDTYITEVTLQKGWNQVLVKCSNSELNRCNFLLRLTNAQGIPLPNLRTAISAEGPINKPNKMAIRHVPNPHLEALHAQLNNEPSNLEHAFILAEAYLRNDNADSAEVVLQNARRLSPNCVITLKLLAETFQRGRRRDEAMVLADRITALAPDLLYSVTYKLSEAMGADRMDEAEEIVKRIGKDWPNSQEYYVSAIALAARKDRMAEQRELQQEAFERYPQESLFMTGTAVAVLQRSGNHDSALAVVNKHLEHRYSINGLLFKARVLQDARRYSEWEEAYNDCFALNPAMPGHRYSMAESFAARNDYRKALSAIQLALDDAPSVGSLLMRAGTYFKSAGEPDSARRYFALALRCDPTNFSAREALRDIEGRPSPFTMMRSSNIDSIIAAAPKASDYPEASAVFLFDDTRRVVYNGSRCEIDFEVLVKVLTSEGIDRFKEMSLPGGSSGIVEKAVVKKPDGREIAADRSGSYAVYKGLEPGDCIYYKVRAKEYLTGALYDDFMDDVQFNGSYPVLHSRYQLLVPDSVNFKWSVTGGDVAPSTEKIGKRDLWVWEMKNAPAIKYEIAMPDRESVVTMLQISSIPTWANIINWYRDISQTKSRSSFMVKQLMDTLFPRGTKFSREEIITGVYKYITEDIRYSSVSFRQSGLVPQKAQDVLATRIGDCKDVTTLCIAMLAERGIKAYHTLVKTESYDNTRMLLPSPLAFDHDIVMVDNDGKPLYIDCTAPGLPLGSVPFGDIDARSLVIHPGWRDLQTIQRKTLPPNNVFLTSTIQVHEDLSASVALHYTHTGARTIFYREGWKDKTEQELERSLTESLSSDYGDVTFKNLNIMYLDTLLDKIEYTLEFDVQNFVMEAADLYILRVPWYDPYRPDGALSYATRKYPIQFRHYIDTLHEDVEVFVPEGYEAWGIDKLKNHEGLRSTITRQASMDRNKLSMMRTEVFERETIPVHQYQNYKTFHNEVMIADRQAILLAPIGTKVTKPRKRETGQSKNP